MDSFFERIGDRLPDKPVIHLHSSLSKVTVYERMVEELTGSGMCIHVSSSTFFNLWKHHFKHVTKVCHTHVHPCISHMIDTPPKLAIHFSRPSP